MNLNSGVTFSFPGRQRKADTVCLDAAGSRRHNDAMLIPAVILTSDRSSADNSRELQS
jgi:hypothetical protein